MKQVIAIVGAAKPTRLGVIADMSQIQLHAGAALNAMADADPKTCRIDGMAILTPKWSTAPKPGSRRGRSRHRQSVAGCSQHPCALSLIARKDRATRERSE